MEFSEKQNYKTKNKKEKRRERDIERRRETAHAALCIRLFFAVALFCCAYDPFHHKLLFST